MALMLYLTDFSTASKMLNLNNPIQETVRFRSVGSGTVLLSSVPKERDICECGKNQSFVATSINCMQLKSQILIKFKICNLQIL